MGSYLWYGKGVPKISYEGRMTHRSQLLLIGVDRSYWGESFFGKKGMELFG
jgi:hypothetical protein